jgi:FHA domain
MDDTAAGVPQDGGPPRLVMALGGLAPEGAEPQEFSLRPGVTVVGSAPDADLQPPGLDGHHAEIRHQQDHDEYVWVDLGTARGSRVDGQPMSEQGLHTDDRIEVGDRMLVYYREESADHIRPGGGRQGGEGEGHPRDA